MDLSISQLRAIENSLTYSLMYCKTRKQEDELTEILFIIKRQRQKLQEK